MLLIFYSFLAGLVTILSPCILPLLPIILAGGVGGDRRRPLGVILGFVTSFTLATLLLATIVKATGLSADFLRSVAIFILFLFGLVLVVPPLQLAWERLAARLSSGAGTTNRSGLKGGFLIGLSLGIVWTPCVGPILASVITLAATSEVTTTTLFITFAYSVGTAIPLFLIMQGSHAFLSRLDWFKRNSRQIQQVFGILMLVTALMLYLQLDRKFQRFVIETFPNYGAGLTKLEGNKQVQQSLTTLKKSGGKQMQVKLDNKGKAPELKGGQEWLNSEPLTLAGLKGKVVLVDFWTYSCVNCIRTLPYLRAWHDKYKDKGLVIIGIHSPEFEFEKSLDNLQSAVQDFELKYPVVQDNDFNIWRAYDNHYWPAKYLVDKDGVIRYTHFGEGKYEETEAVIQGLLGEEAELVDMPQYQNESRSPETYLGYWRLTNVVSTPAVKQDQLTTYSTRDSFSTNGVGFVGNWTVRREYAEAEPGGSLRFRFDAKEVNLVMRPVDPASPQSVEVLLDGQPAGTLTIDKDQLYNLVKLDQGENHLIEINFPQGGVEVYAFTFG